MTTALYMIRKPAGVLRGEATLVFNGYGYRAGVVGPVWSDPAREEPIQAVLFTDEDMAQEEAKKHGPFAKVVRL